MNQSTFAERVRKWQKELGDLLREAEKKNDLTAVQILQNYQPIFQTFVDLLERNSPAKEDSHHKGLLPSQSELWPEKSSSSNIHQLIERISQKISKLSLPNVASPSKK